MSALSLDQSFANLTTNINVGIDEVVSVFVSRYEQQLLKRKAELQSNIRSLKQSVAQHEQAMIDSIDRNLYAGSIESIGLTVAVNNVRVDRASQNRKQMCIEVVVRGVFNGTDSAFWQTKRVAATQNDIDTITQYDEQIENATAQLTEVLAQLKAINQKERQIRGRIAEMKLEQAGYTNLLSDQRLVELTNID